ncbi:MAG TPA: hypothetical protein VIK19_01545, partial [Syntrophales bacterium]
SQVRIERERIIALVHKGADRHRRPRGRRESPGYLLAGFIPILNQSAIFVGIVIGSSTYKQSACVASSSPP